MHTKNGHIFMLWDESHLWGLLLRHTLTSWKLPLTIIDSQDIQQGILTRESPSLLIVPGGWARLKSLRLGKSGRDAIRRYIAAGGHYLGFCGGAGLGLRTEGEHHYLGLCSWGKKPYAQRVPNFSGHLYTRVTLPATPGECTLKLPAWWPAQFAATPDANVHVLARYGRPARDFWAADINIGQCCAADLKEWEKIYGIKLDPAPLRDEACMISGKYDQGTYILSYVHLETPSSPQANGLLAHFLKEKVPGLVMDSTISPAWDIARLETRWLDRDLLQLQECLDEIITLARNSFLMSWRLPWLLGWRRGIPGSQINFLYAMTREAQHAFPTPKAQEFWNEHGAGCIALASHFKTEVCAYLLHERLILAKNLPSSPAASSSPKLEQQRRELFGKFPGYGGIYGEILVILDRLLWLLVSGPNA
ncbi:MAG: BPL-N domain-containing protein [Desulfoplanes sp.]